MRTSALVDLLKFEARDWSRATLTSLINNIQNIMLTSVPLSNTRFIDTTTGIDLKLTTTAAKFAYSANSTDMSALGTDTLFSIDYVYTGDILTGDDVTEISCVKLDGNESTPAKIIFSEDPGAQDVYVRGYKNPTQVTSESVQLSIPSQYVLTHLYEGVMGWIEQTTNGKSERWVNFNQNLLQDFYSGMNSNIGVIDRPVRQGGF